MSDWKRNTLSNSIIKKVYRVRSSSSYFFDKEKRKQNKKKKKKLFNAS